MHLPVFVSRLAKSAAASTLLLACLGAGPAGASGLTEFQFQDVNGDSVTFTSLRVFDAQGNLRQSLMGSAGGSFLVAVPGDGKLRFEFPPSERLGAIRSLEYRTDPRDFIGTEVVTLPGFPILDPEASAASGASNDDCDGAMPLAVGDTVLGDTTGAAADPEAVDCDMATANGPGDWYAVTGTGNTMTVSTCNAGTDPLFDTKLSVFCGSCASGLVCVGGNDDSGCPGTFHSEVSWAAEAGRTYLVFVHGFAGATGFYELSVADDGVPAVPTVSCPVELDVDCEGYDDLFLACADGARNHGEFVSCVAHQLNVMKMLGMISGSEKGDIQKCAARADLP